MPRKDASGGPISAQAQQDLVSEGIENFELPKSIITKIAKSVLPENAKLQKDTVLSLIKGSTVFINYLAATAHDVAVQKQHKSISASDVLKALEIIEFSDLAELFQVELQAYRDLAKTDKDIKAKPAKKAPSAAPAQQASTASAKSKGKEKAKEAFTSAPLRTNPYPSISAPPEPEMDVDQEEEVVEGDEEEPEDFIEEVDEDEDEEEEDIEDRMAVEEEELRADAKGVEERAIVADAD